MLSLLSDEFRRWGLPALDSALVSAINDKSGFASASLARTLENVRSPIKRHPELRHLTDLLNASIETLDAMHVQLSEAHGVVQPVAYQRSVDTSRADPCRIDRTRRWG